MTPEYSIQNIVKRRRGSKMEPRAVRRARMVSWAGMAEALIKARGADPSKLSPGQLVLWYYRRSKVPMAAITAKRYGGQGRQSLLKTLGEQESRNA